MSSLPANSAPPTAVVRQRYRLVCPRCGQPVRRARRRGWQRLLLAGSSLARFRCTDAECDWSGLLTRRLDTGPPRPTTRFVTVLRGLVPLVFSGLSAAAAAAAAFSRRERQATPMRPVAQQPPTVY